MTVVNRRWISGAIVEGNSALDLELMALLHCRVVRDGDGHARNACKCRGRRKRHSN